jgi:hypothetical protein
MAGEGGAVGGKTARGILNAALRFQIFD